MDCLLDTSAALSPSQVSQVVARKSFVRHRNKIRVALWNKLPAHLTEEATDTVVSAYPNTAGKWEKTGPDERKVTHREKKTSAVSRQVVHNAALLPDTSFSSQSTRFSQLRTENNIIMSGTELLNG